MKNIFSFCKVIYTSANIIQRFVGACFFGLILGATFWESYQEKILSEMWEKNKMFYIIVLVAFLLCFFGIKSLKPILEIIFKKK